MTDKPLIVDGRPFLGRIEEQKQFRAALREVLNPSVGETLPYIFLLYGDGGIGKTSLVHRFRDIGLSEGKFQILSIDWEVEKDRNPNLTVGRENISPESVFDVIFDRAKDKDWEKQFNEYENLRVKRQKVYHTALNAVSGGGDKDEVARLRGVGHEAIAKIVRLGLPGIGSTGEKLAKAFIELGIEVGAKQATALWGSLVERLQRYLENRDYELFINPHKSLARALATGFSNLAQRKPLFVLLDTYELVDRVDLWMREIIQNSGPNVIWVISGRDDLYRDRGGFGNNYFRGYATDFPSHLIPYDVGRLALNDLIAYFSESVPGRPLDSETAEIINRITRGIPLALRETAEIWAKGVALEDIIGDITNSTPNHEIVKRMTDRYLLHAVTPQDREALYALALAGSDVEILRAMLNPANEAGFDLYARLGQLQRDYASVHFEKAHLHEEPAWFLREYLKKTPGLRHENWCQRILNQAKIVLQDRLLKHEDELPLLEDRCEDDQWVRDVLALAQYLFWLDETDAWKWLIPSFVLGLAYSRALARGLLEVATQWKEQMDTRGKNRLKKLLTIGTTDDVEMISTLVDCRRASWFKVNHEDELEAILHLKQGQIFYRQECYRDALSQYESAERRLPYGRHSLRKQLAEASYNLSEKFLWPRSNCRGVPSDDGLEAARLAVALDKDHSRAWNNYGAALYFKGREIEAETAYRTAIKLEENFSEPYNGIGYIYLEKGQFSEAETFFQKAVERDRKSAFPLCGLGGLYTFQGKYKDAETIIKKAIKLNPNLAASHFALGNLFFEKGAFVDAEGAFQKAIQHDPEDAMLHFGLGCLHLFRSDLNDAETTFMIAIQKDNMSDKELGAVFNGLGWVYLLKGNFEKSRFYYQEEIRVYPKQSCNANIMLGIMARYLRDKDDFPYFQQALILWDIDWQVHLGTSMELLEEKALALLCLGEHKDAISTLREALLHRLPSDKISFEIYELLRIAPNPPEGIDEMIAILQESSPS